MGRRRFKGYKIENLEIVDTTTDGKGVAKQDGVVFFVEKTVPGDVIDAWVYKKAKGVPVARVETMHKESPFRIEARCQHFGDCGGCKWQSLSYEQQLIYKEKHVMDAMERIGGLEIQERKPIIGGKEPFNYRNKVEFSFSNKRWVPPAELGTGVKIDWYGALGYHVAKFFDKIIKIETCHLHIPIVDEIRNELREISQEWEIPYYDIRQHTGYLRNIVFRNSEGSGELMVILLVGEDDQGPVDRIFTHLEEKFPQITSFIWIYNHKPNSTYADLEPRIWKGDPFITESLGQWKYRISPISFFQTNTSQAQILYDVVRDFVGEKTGTIYDLYCGAGSIGIYLSDLAEKIVGVEYVEDAVKDAWENVKLNNLEHFSFTAGNMKLILNDEFVAREGKPDVIVTDPPRAGMDAPVVEQILKLEAPKIVYVSCNASTQARDLALLQEKYELKVIQPVDMFPQTAHVENVALLELRS